MSGHAIDAASPAGGDTRLPWSGLLALAGLAVGAMGYRRRVRTAT